MEYSEFLSSESGYIQIDSFIDKGMRNKIFLEKKEHSSEYLIYSVSILI